MSVVNPDELPTNSQQMAVLDRTLFPNPEHEPAEPPPQTPKASVNPMLLVALGFLLLGVIGAGAIVFSQSQTIDKLNTKLDDTNTQLTELIEKGDTEAVTELKREIAGLNEKVTLLEADLERFNADGEDGGLADLLVRRQDTLLSIDELLDGPKRAYGGRIPDDVKAWREDHSKLSNQWAKLAHDELKAEVERLEDLRKKILYTEISQPRPKEPVVSKAPVVPMEP